MHNGSRSRHPWLIPAVIAYAACLSTVAALAFIGDTRAESVVAALRHFTPSQIETGNAYFRYGIVPTTLYQLVLVALLTLYVLRGTHARFYARISATVRNDFARLFISFAVILLVMGIVLLPFAIYAGYARGKAFGLVTTDPATWIARWCLTRLIGAAVTALIGAALALIIARTRRYLVHVPAVFLAISLLLAYAMPRVITPLFYDTVPIADGALKKKITSMVERYGIAAGSIFVIKKSAYGRDANAYFIGTGPTGRIYLYDTLIANFTDDEILMVLAHELCHYREEHVLIGSLLWSLGIALALFAATRLARRRPELHPRSLVGGDHALLVIVLIIVSYAASPLENAASRAMERRCDRFALAATGDPAGFITMKRRLTATNRGAILPHPAYVWQHYSHPTVLERIHAAEEFAARTSK